MRKIGFSNVGFVQQLKGHTYIKLHGKLHKYNAEHPFEIITMDLAGPFSMSRRGNWHILAVVDYFSNWCETYSVPTMDAPEIVSLCGKIDLTLWCPIGVAHRTRKEDMCR